ncbi:hypothetical protein C4D60_Mb10t01630 [Musa balbisiana]|uniref:Uncharacterized protein n=1 Tax=Musa balbisiana TaxID=52838 RepID=A0A4S8IV97_MUSBA|nr:hypothetical protein C4D60_Mb10t01630 [Musa balbisiana]
MTQQWWHKRGRRTKTTNDGGDRRSCEDILSPSNQPAAHHQTQMTPPMKKSLSPVAKRTCNDLLPSRT